MTEERRADVSTKACGLLEKQGLWRESGSILFYAPLAGELDIWRLVGDSLAAGKTVALPRFDPGSRRYIACRIQKLGEDIRQGQFGIREPADHCVEIELSRMELVLVPGVAFDPSGHRLGRGKGFYDRLLAEARGTLCGVAFDEQIVAEIPVEAHDVHLDYVLTPSRWIEV